MLYDYAYPSNYEEFKTYYEVSYRDYKEMDAIWQALGGQLDKIQDGILTVIYAMFIKYADEYAISLWEEFLWIRYDGPRTLDERKQMVLSFFIDNGHIGEPEIRELLSVFTTAQCSMALVGGSLHLDIIRNNGEFFQLSDFYYILQIKLPGHLGLFNRVELPVDGAMYLGCATTAYKLETLNHPDDLKMNPDREFPSQLYCAATITSMKETLINSPNDLVLQQ